MDPEDLRVAIEARLKDPVKKREASTVSLPDRECKAAIDQIAHVSGST
jgi:hypothetical protein